MQSCSFKTLRTFLIWSLIFGGSDMFFHFQRYSRLCSQSNHWAAGKSFSIADCAAAPALFYARIVAPFSSGHVKLSHYFDRLITITYDNFLTRSENFFYSTSIVLL